MAKKAIASFERKRKADWPVLPGSNVDCLYRGLGIEDQVLSVAILIDRFYRFSVRDSLLEILYLALSSRSVIWTFLFLVSISSMSEAAYFLAPIIQPLKICQSHLTFSAAWPVLYSAPRSPTSAAASTASVVGPGHSSQIYAATISCPLVIPPSPLVSTSPAAFSSLDKSRKAKTTHHYSTPSHPSSTSYRSTPCPETPSLNRPRDFSDPSPSFL